jgi:hypothetical protein
VAGVPIIQTSGSVSGLGTAGQGREDLDVGETITFSDTEPSNSGQTYLWNLLDKPIGSSAVLTSPTSPTPTLVPDVVGSYRVSALVNSTFTSTIVIAVPTPNRLLRIPGFNEQLHYNGAGNQRGWQQAQHSLYTQVDLLGKLFKNYAEVYLSANQTARFAVGQHIEFNSVVRVGLTSGDVSVSTGVDQANGDISLANHRYFFIAYTLGNCTDPGALFWSVTDTGGTGIIGEDTLGISGGRMLSNGAAGGETCGAYTFGVVTSPKTLQLRFTLSTNPTSLAGRIWFFALP